MRTHEFVQSNECERVTRDSSATGLTGDAQTPGRNATAPEIALQGRLKRTRACRLQTLVLGSGSRTRTYDQSVNSRPLYQLSYSGKRVGTLSWDRGAVKRVRSGKCTRQRGVQVGRTEWIRI